MADSVGVNEQEQQQQQQQHSDGSTAPRRRQPLGWCVDGDHTFAGTPREARPSLWVTAQLLPMAFRLWRHISHERSEGRDGVIDPFTSAAPTQVSGVPLGGLGGGTVGRGWKGDFNRWAIVPGKYTHASVAADQFTLCLRRDGVTVYQKVLFPGKEHANQLRAWDWTFPPEHYHYRALYPQAWSTYDIPEHGVTLICHQISPVIPHDYRTSSLPAGAFVWTVKLAPDHGDVEVTIMMTFQNGCGQRNDADTAGHLNTVFREPCRDGVSTAAGVVLKHAPSLDGKRSLPGYSMAIAAKETDAVTVTRTCTFRTDSGTGVWEHLRSHGELADHDGESAPSNGQCAIAAAVAASRHVRSGTEGTIEFTLVWDMPRVEFPLDKEEGPKWVRRYCRFFGKDATACPSLAATALDEWPTWAANINEWQAPVLTDDSLPAWYRSALFNELYFLADGGTLWLHPEESCQDVEPLHLPRQDGQDDGSAYPDSYPDDIGYFAYLEGHVYRMYNTLDVAFYASFALATLWPRLQASVAEHFASTLALDDPSVRKTLMSGCAAPRKTPGCLPHDIGSPDEAPWQMLNSYHLHDTADWKDLNTKFVLQVYRDFIATSDQRLLKRLWPVCCAAMEQPLAQDQDGDGLLENSGFADQTYDAWTVTGPSAYCGGLFLAALQVMTTMAEHPAINDQAASRKYSDILSRGREAYVAKLWNERGGYFNYDSSGSGHSDSIQADQLAGHWYLLSCGLPSYIAPDMAKRVLNTVFEFNVMQFAKGRRGAVNGMKPSGEVDDSSMMSVEVWTGVTYALAATMLLEGLEPQAFITAQGIYETCYNEFGYGFNTPEAFLQDGAYRSLGYMRPLAIWAMEWARHKRASTPRPTQPE